MKTYRCGTVSNIINGFCGWAIQEKKWWGWETLCVYHDEDLFDEAVERLMDNPNCIVL